MRTRRDTGWVEKTFGRFAWRESATRPGAIEILGDWEQKNIVGLRPPLALVDGQGRAVREIRCHRLIARPLREVLEELAEAGLSHLINTFDGCFVPRHLLWDPRRGLSRHAWGIAVDLNARLFPYGSAAKQDARLVEAFARHGFAWGGRWPTPDPMHFEVVELPAARREVTIVLDGKRLARGFVEEGRAIGPVRELAEALGARVEARLEEGEVLIESSDGGEWR